MRTIWRVVRVGILGVLCFVVAIAAAGRYRWHRHSVIARETAIESVTGVDE
jgi:hypothetical protein